MHLIRLPSSQLGANLQKPPPQRQKKPKNNSINQLLRISRKQPKTTN
jgi:hypothetical protein